jgi:hypothetical protein
MNKPIDVLTTELIEKHLNRKRKHRFDLVVDIDSQMFYPVPREIEHKDFIPTIQHERDGAMIPFYLLLRKHKGQYYLREIATGASSFESEKKVTHTPAELKRAQGLAWLLIQRSPIINYKAIKRDVVFRTYCNYQKN